MRAAQNYLALEALRLLRTSYLILVLSLSLLANGQGDSALYKKLDQLADSIWNITYSDPEAALMLCDTLHSKLQGTEFDDIRLLCLESQGEIHHVLADLDRSVHYYRKALALSRSLEDKVNECRLLGLIGTDMGIGGQTEESIAILDSAVALAEATNDTAALCYSLTRLSNIHAITLNAEFATTTGFDAMQHCRAVKDWRTLASVHSSLASVHLNLHNHEEAVRQHKLAIQIYDSVGFTRNVLSSRSNLAIVYHEQGDLIQAKALNRQVIAETDTLKAAVIRTATRLNLALILLDQDSLALSKSLAMEALEMAETENLSTYRINALVTLGRIALEQGYQARALSFLEKSLELLEGTDNLKQEIEALLYLSQAHQQLDDHQSAFELIEKRSSLKDSLFQMQKSEEINRLQIQFNTERKNQEIAALAAQNQLEQEKNKWLKLGIGGMCTATLFIIYGLIQRRKRATESLKNKLELEKSERQRLDEQLDHKQRELTAKALHLAQKNELLQDLKKELDLLRTSDVGQDVQAISNKIRFDQQIDNNWEQFTKAFTETNKGFFDRIRSKHPDVSKAELRLSALLSMNLNSKEVGSVLNISDEGVRKARYRLRKRLELNKEDKLEQYLAAI